MRRAPDGRRPPGLRARPGSSPYRRGEGRHLDDEPRELVELDFASWKNPWAEFDDEAPDGDPEDNKVLTLRKLLETVADAGRRVELAIETKHPTRYGGSGGAPPRRAADRLRLDRGGLAGAGDELSFTALQRVERMAPKIPKVMLVEKAHHWPMLRRAVGRDWIIGPGISELRDHPGLGRHLRLADREIHVWTVNTEEELQICLDLGVTAVITDKPAYMLELLGAP